MIDSGMAAVIVAPISAAVSLSTEIARRRDKQANAKERRPKSDAETRSIDADTYTKQLAMISALRDELEEERAARRADNERFEARMAAMEQRHAAEIGNLTSRIRALEKENHRLLRENHELRSEKGQK